MDTSREDRAGGNILTGRTGTHPTRPEQVSPESSQMVATSKQESGSSGKILRQV